jgi:multicomponent K+:H+ antiporter subunit F
MDKPAQQVVRNNLLIVLALAVVLGLVSRYFDEGGLFLFGVLYLGQVATNCLLGIRHWGSKDSKTGPAPYFLSMLLVLIIGFGSCTGMLAYLNVNGGPPQ